MADEGTTITVPHVDPVEDTRPKDVEEPGFVVICWDDPVNLMDYVTHVFQRVFGWNKTKAEFHMLEVHTKGKSALVRETLEKAEHYVHRLHGYGLHSTLERL